MILTDAIPQRIAAALSEDENGCWIWSGRQNSNGYGMTTKTNSHTSVVVHRYVYELLVGPIPPGLDLDHLCRVRLCANPKHLEPVTRRENLLRGQTLNGKAAAATHCPAGHPYDGENLHVNPRGHRYCRECHRRKEAARRVRLGEQHRAKQREYDQAYRDRKKAAAVP
jgi:hypothetical protein